MMFLKKISATRARACVRSSIIPLGSERISFHEGCGRILAEDVQALCDHPPFDRSAMDGYAVLAGSTFYATPENPVRLRKGEEARRIMTGEPIPSGFDAVVMIEYVEDLGDEIRVSRSVVPGENVALRGEDFRQGEIILRKGRVLLPHDIGTLVAAGITKIEVRRSPRVGIISTGDEIVDPARIKRWNGAEEGKIPDINSYTLSSLVGGAGGIPVRCGVLKDDPDVLKSTIKSYTGFDLLLITGGSSVGDRDFLGKVIDELGKLLFHGVAIKPGGPLGFGFINNTPVFILPGYPLAAIVSFELFVRDALSIMQGLPPKIPYESLTAKLLRKIPSQVGRLDFVRVKLINEGGDLYAEPLGSGGSGSIGRLSKADGFLLVDEPLEGIDEGETVTVYRYPGSQEVRA